MGYLGSVVGVRLVIPIAANYIFRSESQAKKHHKKKKKKKKKPFPRSLRWS